MTLALKFHARSQPRTLLEELTAHTRPLAGFKGAASQRGEGAKREGEGREREKRCREGGTEDGREVGTGPPIG